MPPILWYKALLNSHRVPFQSVLLVVASAIVLTSLVVSDKLVSKVAEEERLKMEIWAMSARQMAADDESEEPCIDIMLKILQSNNTIPAILCDETDNVISHNNIKLSSRDSIHQLQHKLKQFKEGYPPIKIEMGNNKTQYLYYSDSSTLRQIQYFPYIQLTVILIFIFIAIRAVLATKRAEQNRIWVGLSKETAHQLGTPISSLIAWTELLRMGSLSPEVIEEIEKDTERLQTIADRFQKIGSAPIKSVINLNNVIEETLEYLAPRISNKVKIHCSIPQQDILVQGSTTLLSWAIENMIKNAVDAMLGKGRIDLVLEKKGGKVRIDLSDTGRGIPKGKLSAVFQPGYTTRERGWGLGLSLTKRIIEEYHSGSIFIPRSELGVGTTFRIILPTCDPHTPPHTYPSADEMIS